VNSALFGGKVRHRRYVHSKRSFEYSLYLNWLDLDEVKSLFKWPLLFSAGSLPSIVKFNRNNYFRPEKKDLKQAVIEEVAERTGLKVDGKVYLMTSLQYFGICFNPVSFYYCYNQQNELLAVLAEITNTPWRERFSYVVNMHKSKVHKFPKDFHVSPFMPMDMNYEWTFNKPSETAAIHMKNFKSSELHFDVTMKLKKSKFTYFSMLKLSIIQPVIPLKVLSAIYWQALLLWIKKVPFFENPKTTILKQGVSHEQ
jgi:uncharacterized protein